MTKQQTATEQQLMSRPLAEADPAEAVARAGQDIEADARLTGGVFGGPFGFVGVVARAPTARKLAHHLAPVIAVGAQNLAQQFLVGAGAGSDLRCGVLVPVKLAQRR